MPVIDASWLVALLDADDAWHGSARQQLEEAAGVDVCPVTLAEAMYILEQRQAGDTRADRRRRAAEAVSSFLTTSNTRVKEATGAAEALGLVQARPALSFPDALVFTFARQTGQPLWTFDRNQAAALKVS